MAPPNAPPGDGTRQGLDPAWIATDQFITTNLHRDASLDASLAAAHLNAHVNNLPDIAVSATQGKFLQLQARALGVTQALEIGTLAGYSTIWLAKASERINVTTAEVDEKHARVARENLERAGVGSRVNVVVGAGLDVMAQLSDEVKAGKRDKFGLVFIDADKENCWNYFNKAVGELCKPGAMVVVDNVVRRGLVAKEGADGDSRVRGVRECIEMAGRDGRVDATVLQLVGEKNYDGFLIAVVNEEGV
ncbi:O-methyltransferas-like protein family 3 [Saccharata proteae CBS 121410]|uniref:O-methyltransferas-like protein family 3 n=1 Tax=Saccharata proteae CBS 121410 TaxID=1314787 RepID=A0A9P4HKT3_9PEZI|nr:O-methyltransferas-like protein family 3 [Saccharata proteae CBS 121410]